jgi:hypothetical protein
MDIRVSERRPGAAGGILRDPYGCRVAALEDEGAAVARSGDYLIAVTHAPPAGRYESAGAELVWRTAAPGSTVRLEVAVADAEDGRFVPGLTVYVAVERDGRTYAARQCGFHWYPDMHRYAAEVRVPTGVYDVTVRIAAPGFPRHDQVAGRRYADPAVLRFDGVRIAAGGDPG